MKPKNIEQLQDFLLESLDRFNKDKIDVHMMGIISKSTEVMMTSLKVQLAYNAMRKEMPNIKFLQDSNNGKEVKDAQPLKLVKI